MKTCGADEKSVHNFKARILAKCVGTSAVFTNNTQREQQDDVVYSTNSHFITCWEDNESERSSPVAIDDGELFSHFIRVWSSRAAEKRIKAEWNVEIESVERRSVLVWNRFETRAKATVGMWSQDTFGIILFSTSKVKDMEMKIFKRKGRRTRMSLDSKRSSRK
jgi:hypothetical protein